MTVHVCLFLLSFLFVFIIIVITSLFLNSCTERWGGISPWGLMKYSDFDSDCDKEGFMSLVQSTQPIQGPGKRSLLTLTPRPPTFQLGPRVLVYACFCCSCLVLAHLHVTLVTGGRT